MRATTISMGQAIYTVSARPIEFGRGTIVQGGFTIADGWEG